MIDFVKVKIKTGRTGGVPLHEQISQWTKTPSKDGRDCYKSDEYPAMIFTLYNSGQVDMEGSLHKYWNSKQNQGAHNYNDFTRIDLYDTIYDICQRLQIAPAEAVLKNLEFGVNLQVPFSPPKLVRDLVAFKTEPFGRMYVRGEGTYYLADTEDYFVKCYDKGAHYKQRSKNIIRFEVKAVVMRCLKKAGVKTLEDLMKAEKLATLGKMLSEAWEFVLIRERPPADELTAKEREIVDRVLYADLEGIDHRRKYDLIKRYEAILERTLHQADRKTLVAVLIVEKWEQLTKGDLSDYQAAHRSQPAATVANPDKCDDPLPAATTGNPDFCSNPQQVAEIPEIGQMRHLSIAGICPNHQLELFTSSTPPPATATLTTTTTAADGCQIKKRKRDYHTEQYYIEHNRRNEKSNGPNNLFRRIVRPLKHPQFIDPMETLRLSPDQTVLLHRIDPTRLQRAGLF